MKVITNSRIEVERRIGAQSELGIMYLLELDTISLNTN